MPVLARRSSRLWASLATLITLGITTVVVAAPAAADPIESCTLTSGAIVAVDFRPWGGQVLRGCDATPTTGFDLLHEAGFTTTGTVHDGPAFICRIGNATFDAGTQYPKLDQEACTLTPPATAYWSYWFASPGQQTWTYSPLGAMAKVPGHGEVQAWVYGGTDVGGTTGRPSFTPDEVRATGATPTPTATTAEPSVPGAQPTSAQVAAAAAYLVGELTDGDHVYNADWEWVDFTRTIVVATGLAASGGQAPVLAKMLDYLAAHVDAAVFPDGVAAPPNQYNAATLSLLVTITGGEPHAFGGRDLPAVLTDRVCTAVDPLAGCGAAGDFAGSFSPSAHAMALLALRRAGITPPASTVERLLQWQCAGGGFADSLINPGEWCTPDPANTGEALLALTVLGGHDTAITAAKKYLTEAQQSGGGFLPYVGAAGPETYVTAVAAQGLIATAATQPAAAAASFLAARITADGALAADPASAEPDLMATSGALVTLAGGNLATLRHPLGGEEPPQGPTPDLAKGVKWLVAPKQLIDGRYYESFPGFPDFGLSIDGAFALAAAGGDDAKLRAITEFIRSGGQVGDSEFTVDGWLGVGTSYPSGGAIGKVALLSQVTGYDPRSFGGHDLIAALQGITCASVDTAVGCAGKGNYRYATSVFSQSLGIMAQVRAGQQQEAHAPIEYLKQLQRATGAFPSLIPADGSGDEVDSTAMAAMALALLTDDPAATAAVDKALTWLAAQQKPDGGFPGASGNSTNSTALAIQGLTLRQTAYTAHIGKALVFLAGQQNSDGGFNVAAGGQPGSDVRASTQVVSGATGISFGILLRDVHDGVDPTPSPSASTSASPSQTTVPPPASGDTPGTAGPGGMPVTGLPLAAMVVAAAVAIIVGVVLLLLARQRRREADAPGEAS